MHVLQLWAINLTKSLNWQPNNMKEVSANKMVSNHCWWPWTNQGPVSFAACVSPLQSLNWVDWFDTAELKWVPTHPLPPRLSCFPLFTNDWIYLSSAQGPLGGRKAAFQHQKKQHPPHTQKYSHCLLPFNLLFKNLFFKRSTEKQTSKTMQPILRMNVTV